MNNNMLYTEEKCDVTLPWKSMGYPVLLPSAIMGMKVIQIIQINCDICNNTVYRDREILLTWQRDVTTSLVTLCITCCF